MMFRAETPFQVLGVPEHASPKTVRIAYLEWAKKWHPDGHPPAQRGEAELRFKQIAEAYRQCQLIEQGKRFSKRHVAYKRPVAREPKYASPSASVTRPQGLAWTASLASRAVGALSILGLGALLYLSNASVSHVWQQKNESKSFERMIERRALTSKVQHP